MTGVVTRAPVRRNSWLGVPEAASQRLLLNGMTFGKNERPSAATPLSIIARANPNPMRSSESSRPADHEITSAQQVNAKSHNHSNIRWTRHDALRLACRVAPIRVVMIVSPRYARGTHR